MSTHHNRIAILGYSGYAAKPITRALIQAGGPVRLLNRKGSKSSADAEEYLTLGKNVSVGEIDYEDAKTHGKAFEDIDIVISLVGAPGITQQTLIIPSLSTSPSVKLFVPSELGGDYTPEEGSTVSFLKEKDHVIEALGKAGVAWTKVRIGGFAEFSLGIPIVGIDVKGNSLTGLEGILDNAVPITSTPYTGAGFASIFSSTPPSELRNKSINLIEVFAKGSDIVSALSAKHGSDTTVKYESAEAIEAQSKSGQDFPALSALVKKQWVEGRGLSKAGVETWQVEGYQKATLEEWIGGKIRGLPKALGGTE